VSVSEYRWVPLPPDFATTVTDCTVDEASSFRRQSRWTTHAKIRSGVYESYLDGRIRKVLVASLVRERERLIAAARNPTGKRPVGRPKKSECAPSITMEVETT
jgi:hypothetical protein